MNLTLVLASVSGMLTLISACFYFGYSQTPTVLAVCSSILLLYTYTLHRSQFKTDYKTTDIHRDLRRLWPLVFIGVVGVLVYGGYALVSTSPGYVIGGKRK